MRCFQAWLATVYKLNVHALNKPLSIPFRVKDSPMVDSSLQLLLRSPLSPGCSIPHNDYRCIPHRVGCTHVPPHSPWAIVFNQNLPTHKRPRASSHMQRLPSLPPIDSEPTCLNNDRQHRLHVLCKQAGRSLLSLALRRSCEALELMPCEQHPDISHLSSRSHEYHHGRIKHMLSLGSRMGDKRDDHPQHILHLGLPTLDLFATAKNKKCLKFFSRPGLGKHSLGDAFMISWDQNLLYAFPPIPVLHRVLTNIRTDCAMVILIALSWPRQPWFLFLTRMSTCPLISLHLTPNLLLQQPDQLSSPKPAHASPQSLVPTWFFQNELACSEQVQRVCLHIRTQSTCTTYPQKWKRLSQWCSTKQIPPTYAPLLFILDYLLVLKQSGLSFRFFKVHLAAITTLHDKINNTSVFAHSITKCFLKRLLLIPIPRH
ncbi:uncharacterized protein LOC115646540 [Gopherus evgoodei]|uniref:uncharacterized protein LOC115646540 n=1 Tax=Gopherus evgoodei TaxID=1825980 RepID=UPI0011CF6AEF|nr:uncharacterized protein LOC115646540 [Gopherus evgoodei]